jgi:hypothetical protein
MQLAQHRSYIDRGYVEQMLALIENTTDSAGQAFWLALLLTQGVEVAEAVVTAAIETVPCEEFTQSALMMEVGKTAWKMSRGIQVSKPDVLKAGLMVPPELRRVVELPSQLRYCFCLRALVGMSAGACGQVMSLQPEEVDCLFQLSVCTLAAAQFNGAARSGFVS